MKMEKGSVSPRAFIFSVYCFMQATVLRSGYVIGVTKQDSWAMAITGFLFSLPMIAIYSGLLKRFPGKNLIEIDDIVFGPVVGKIVSALYLFFFVSLAALNMRDLGSFVSDYLIPGAHMATIFVVFLIGCVYGIYKGLHNLLRLAIVIFLISVTALIINSILVLGDVSPGFLKPVFHLKPMQYLQGTVSVAAISMGEIIVFTMLTPMLEKKAKAGKLLLFGLILAAVSMMLVVIRDIITLGPLVAIVSLPSFESVRYISLSQVLTRLESVYAVILILLFLFKISILLYAFALGLTQILNRKSSLPEEEVPASDGKDGETAKISNKRCRPPLLLVSAALVLFYSLFVFESMMENRDWGATTAPFFSLTFEFLLPAVALLTACLRKLGKTREVKR